MKKGFTLLETILVLGVAGVFATLAIQDQLRDFQIRIADISGAQIAIVGQATDQYMVEYYSDWRNGENAEDLGANQRGGPRDCNSNSTCEITIQTLVNNGLLANWNPNLTNPFGSNYNIVIQKSGGTGMPLLNGLIVTEDPYLSSEEGEPDFNLLGRAIQTAGANAGFSRDIGECTANSICGYGGSFIVNGEDFSNIVTQEGQLGYLVGVSSDQAGLDDRYLRRDGTLPMTGDLNMGANDIENVQRINGVSNSGLRMSTVRVSDDPNDLPPVNAAPEFSTAANVPSTFRGSVVIDDENRDNDDFIARFKQNPTGDEKNFETGSNATVRFNNKDFDAVTFNGGLHFNDNDGSQQITKGDEERGNSGTGYSNIHGDNIISPVSVNDSLSVSGVITNKEDYGRSQGVRIRDRTIDITGYNPRGLATPNNGSAGYVTIGGSDATDPNVQSSLSIKNGTLFVGGNGECGYSGNYSTRLCRSGKGTTRPKSGEISAHDYYIRNLGRDRENIPLSELISPITLKRIQDVGNGSIVNKPDCESGEPKIVLSFNRQTPDGKLNYIRARDYNGYWQIETEAQDNDATSRGSRSGAGIHGPAQVYCDYDNVIDNSGVVY